MRLVIVGTGTDVGKTHVSASLLGHARSLGLRAVGYKPVATGVEGRCEDAERHAIALGAAYVAPTFQYRRAVSPHLAAREDGPPIDLEVVRRRADELGAGAEVLLVETAGGLFTPLADGRTNVDLVRHLAPTVTLLVAADRLGVLHDVTASILAARACVPGVAMTAIVLSAPATSDTSTGHNRGELERLGIGPVVGTFPRLGLEARESRAVAGEVWSALEQL